MRVKFKPEGKKYFVNIFIFDAHLIKVKPIFHNKRYFYNSLESLEKDWDIGWTAIN